MIVLIQGHLVYSNQICIFGLEALNAPTLCKFSVHSSFRLTYNKEVEGLDDRSDVIIRLIMYETR